MSRLVPYLLCALSGALVIGALWAGCDRAEAPETATLRASIETAEAERRAERRADSLLIVTLSALAASETRRADEAASYAADRAAASHRAAQDARDANARADRLARTLATRPEPAPDTEAAEWYAAYRTSEDARETTAAALDTALVTIAAQDTALVHMRSALDSQQTLIAALRESIATLSYQYGQQSEDLASALSLSARHEGRARVYRRQRDLALTAAGIVTGGFITSILAR